jgi:hypothetical protein
VESTLSSALLKLATSYREAVKDDAKGGAIGGAIRGGIVTPAVTAYLRGRRAGLIAIPAGIIGGGLVSGALSGAGSAVTSLIPAIRNSDSPGFRGGAAGAVGGGAAAAVLPTLGIAHPSIKAYIADVVRRANKLGIGKLIPKSTGGRSAVMAAGGALLGGAFGALGGNIHEQVKK